MMEKKYSVLGTIESINLNNLIKDISYGTTINICTNKIKKANGKIGVILAR